MNRMTTCAGTLLACLISLPPSGAEPVTKGRVMADSCAACHGVQGEGPGEIPGIADLTRQGLINKLTDLRDRDHTDATIMHRHAAGYSDADIRAIAEALTGGKEGSP
jgi:sulfide dehydrogenase cytochrome subunit